MAFIHESEEMKAEKENLKKLDIEKLKLIRKTSPNEVTQQEISVLQRLLNNCDNAKESIDLAFPTIERVRSAEQIIELMDNFSSSFWVKTFHGLEDTADDRKLGKCIIQAAAQHIVNYAGECGLVNFYKKMLKGTDNDYYPQSLVKDPEMASEILKALNDRLQKNNDEKLCSNSDIIETRYFLSDYNIWDEVVAKKGDKLSVKNNYAKLSQTMQNIEIAMLKNRHLDDKKSMDSIFEHVVNPNIDKSIKR